MIAVRMHVLHAVALGLLCAPAATAQPLLPTICLSILGAEDLPAAAALQLAIEHELKVPVRVELPCPAQSGSLAVSAAGVGQAKVAFSAPDGHTSGRTVRLPAEAARAAETIALLASSLVRDEAAELLDTLRKAKPLKPAEVLVPPPPAPLPVAVPVPAPLPPTPTSADSEDADTDLPSMAIAIDLFPGFSIPPRRWTKPIRRLSFGVIGAWSAGLNGVEAANIFALKSDRARGFQGAGILCAVANDMQGIQLAGMLNLTGGRLRGVQGSFGINIARRLDHGMQFSMLNIAGPADHGLQFGAANFAIGDFNGVQGGTLNAVKGDVRGIQVGLANFAGGTVRGVQIGVINVAADADVGIGLVSLYWRGRTHLEMWSQDWARAMIGLKHGSKWLHTIVAVGGRSVGDQWQPVVAGGMGLRARLGDRLHLDIDGIHHLLLQADHSEDQTPDHLSQVRAMVGLRVLRSATVFVGLSVNALWLPTGSMVESLTPFSPANAGDKPLCQDCGPPPSAAAVWPGVVVGIAGF